MTGYPLRVGESIIPLFISIPARKREGQDEPARPLRWIDTQSPAIRARFRDLAYYIAQHASYDNETTVPSRSKGKNVDRILPAGYKPLQVLVQPERGLYRESGVLVDNDDALCFYDMDVLPFTRNIDVYQRLRVLMDQGRAFVWMNAILRPKAAFWVRTRASKEEPKAMLNRIHQEIFQGDPECAPALGPSDMWKCFVHSAEILEGMRVFFDEVYRKHVQIIHDAAQEREKARQLQRCADLSEAVAKRADPMVFPEDPLVEAPEETPAQEQIPIGQALSGIAAYVGARGLAPPFTDEFNAYLNREYAPRLDHGLKRPLYEEPLPRCFFGRKSSQLQEIALRLALSMPWGLVGDGVGIPSTLVQKLAHQIYPESFGLSFDVAGNLDASGASKAIRQLVMRGVLEVADHAFRPGGFSKTYRAVHPELISLAQARCTELGFSPRTVDDVDRRWEELTGQALADTPIDGTRDQVVYRLTNLCPTYEVFEEAALRFPGMRQREDRVRFLPTQWEAHVERDRRRAQPTTALQGDGEALEDNPLEMPPG
jgi:hypothetical protein